MSFKKDQAHKLFKDAGIELTDPDMPSYYEWKNLAEYLAKTYHPIFKGPVGNRRHKDIPYFGLLLGNVWHIRESKGFSNDKEALRWLYDNCPDLLTMRKPNQFLNDFTTYETDLKRARKLVREGNLHFGERNK